MAPTKQYAQTIFKLLKSHYPDARMILQWKNNFELLVAIILSAQCTDKKVNEITEKIFPKYRKLKLTSNLFDQKITPEIQEVINFSETILADLEQDIRPTGFYHNKAKNIQEAARVVLGQFHGNIPKTIQDLIKIPGVGRKTANVFLGNAYNIVEGIAVDTHVRKQSQILGLTKQTDPDKIEMDLMKLFPKSQWFELTYLLIEHGRNMRKRKQDRTSCSKKNCVLCNQND